jgi:anti-sigma regulatory factor (Ser/Thr protein kinase)
MSRFGTSGDMKLVLDETITNAIYHAPKTSDGREKYREFSEVALQPHEYVYVECGWDTEKFGVSVSDSQGKLHKETVFRKIERHSAGEGLLDDSGRGLHMSRLFADTMIINIRPDVRTEVILINYISKKYKGYKPLYINELRAPPRRDDEEGG